MTLGDWIWVSLVAMLLGLGAYVLYHAIQARRLERQWREYQKSLGPIIGRRK